MKARVQKNNGNERCKYRDCRGNKKLNCCKKKPIAAHMIDNTKVTQADIRIISNRLAWVNSSIFTSISRACAILNTQSQKILLKIISARISQLKKHAKSSAIDLANEIKYLPCALA
jgi:hypothetical protein|tara:strand:- start:3410 stop:3757 length:348 start_codon:yes stop_codon:yes gene_type:complete